MSTITPTEAHIELAIAVNRCSQILHGGAQLIAESEARAISSLAMVTAESADRNVSLRLENDQLRAEVARLKAALFKEENNRNELAILGARAERAEAELATEREALSKERARLDWLDSRRFDHSHHETGEHLGSEWTVSGKSEENTVRAAIDAAMKEGGK